MRHRFVLSAAVLVLGCGQGAAPESVEPSGRPASLVESPEAHAVVAKLEALRGKAPRLAAFAGAIEREGAWLRARSPGKVASGVDVALPAEGDGAFRLEDRASGVSLEARLADASPKAGELADGHVVYRGAGPGGSDVIHRVLAEGTEDFVVFDRAPSRAQVDYELALGDKVSGLRLVEGTLEVLDAGGAPRLRVSPPYLVDAAGTRREARLSLTGCAYDSDPRAPFRRPVTDPGARSCELEVQWDAGAEVAYPVALDPLWTSTGNLVQARRHHAATKLASGAVLVAGGYYTAVGALDHAEIYDPVSRTWAATTAMHEKREYLALTTLPGGKVLASGGGAGGNGGVLAGIASPTAEVYDPQTGLWTVPENMLFRRYNHTTTLLPSGKVLLAGGATQGNVPFDKAELYDPAAGVHWSAAGTMNGVRRFHTAVLLGSGKVLASGGSDGTTARLATGSLYNPATNTWTATASMAHGRAQHTATLLTPARVIAVGGVEGLAGFSDPEIYDEAANTWTATAIMNDLRRDHGALLLPSGKLLVAGGIDSVDAIASVEVYDPVADTWTLLSPMATTRSGGTLTALDAGGYLFAAGQNSFIPGSSIADDLATADVLGLLSVGEACQAGAECGSGFCSDDVCCNTACSGGCDDCAAALGASADGTCTVRAAGKGATPGCSGHLLCDGESGSCPVTCAGDAACKPAFHCAGGTCVADIANGGACAAATECQSGSCVDGVCCNTACTGECQACSAALKQAGASGTCGPAKEGTDAHDDCQDQGAASCKDDGLCGPAGQCRLYAEGTLGCGAAACLDNAATTFACDGAGTCIAAQALDCGADLCAGGVCGSGCSTDFECSEAGYCEGGQCQPREAGGTACTKDGECEAGHCVDGLCCDEACDGQCEACGEPGAEGTCVPVLGAPRGERPACDAGVDGEPCTARVCDGSVAVSCEGLAEATTACGAAKCEAGVATLGGHCDGQGACQTETKACLPFACAGDTCAEGPCAADGDCADGYLCGGGKCIAGDVCEDHVLRSPGAEPVDCAPYRCEGDRCKVTCGSDTDCVSPMVCDAGQCKASKSVPPAEESADSGCSCRTAPSEGGSAGAALAMALTALAVSRRRNRKGA